MIIIVVFARTGFRTVGYGGNPWPRYLEAKKINAQFVALTSLGSGRSLYLCFTNIDIALILYFSFVFDCSIAISVVFSVLLPCVVNKAFHFYHL